MSDELLFDSERQERRAHKKRLLIPLLVLAGILIAVTVIALILRSGKNPVHPAGEDTLYPYTWQVRSDGSLLLEIPHTDAPDYRWTPANTEPLQILEAQREEKERNSTTRFILSPKEAGRDMVRLKLQRESEGASEAGSEPASKEEALALGYAAPDPEDVIFELTLLVEFTREGDELTGAVLSSSGVRHQGVLHGGDASANPYRIYGKDKARVTVAVKAASDEQDWSCEILSGEDSVEIDGLLYELGEVLVHLRAGETPGESELVLRSEAAAAEIRLRCVREEDASLLVMEHQAQLRDKPEQNPGGQEPDESGNAKPDALIESVSAEADHAEATGD